MLKKLKKFSLPDIEEKVLKFWQTNRIFKQVQARNKGKKKFVFYEGPPTANGRPGIHHVLARSFKDIVLRYKTMQGFDVVRRGGWDTQGLPIELEVEKSLGLNSKKDIEKYGIAEFNAKCKESVWKYKDEWERLTERIGFWIDLEHPYITYENSYIETVWWILKRVWQKKLLYKSHKIVPWCPRCGTALSSHELAQGYKEVVDTSVYVKFKLKPRQKAGNISLGNNAYILSWTTTPWTLPGNVALAVGKRITYTVVKIIDTGEIFIVADNKRDVLNLDYEVVGRVKGDKLIRLRYEPLFSIKPITAPKTAKITHRVYPAEFVTTEEGTGIVHTAVMYGEDDYELGKRLGLPQYHTVDENGNFTSDVPGLRGLFVKAGKTEKKIFEYLKKQGNLFRTDPYKHEYPFCWRCDTPVLYYARDSWFIGMSTLRKKLITANKRIHWIPAHTKEGRFGEWLRDVKDWALSRERYWGTPLPIWECSGCGETEAIGSYKELHERLDGVKNHYILMRHGEAQSNVKNIVDSNPKNKDRYPLTLQGYVQTKRAAQILKRRKAKVDMIFASDFKRASETAEILGDILGVAVKFDKRLREINTGEFHGQLPEAYHRYFADMQEKFTKRPPGGEHLRDVARRMYYFVKEIEKKYKGKTVLIISHAYPLWMLETVMRGWSEEHAMYEKYEREKKKQYDFINVGEIQEVELLNTSRNEWGFADFHRPYIDEIIFSCSKCKKKMKRVPEVIDAWFDSGSMPFAQAHFPFEKSLDFPAEFIAEGVDQTRGWFYSLLAIAILLERKSPYKNVISHGLVLDAYGQKMSKSKGNIVSPWDMANQFGIDAVRWYFYTTNAPGEPKRFNERELTKTLRNFIFLIYNSFIFLDTYVKNPKFGQNPKLANVLDRWILARLNKTVTDVTKRLELYDINRAGKSISVLVDDLSRWYIRRSRRRFQKPESKRDYKNASYTLSVVLLTLSKLIAPFMPFSAEALYQSLKLKVAGYAFKNSVHLEQWPRLERKLLDKRLLANMDEIRRIASEVLAKRNEASIKVRQPLASLKIRGAEPAIQDNKKLVSILKEEVNVKRVIFRKDVGEAIELDTRVTHKLEEEGWLRELVRVVQQMRQDAGLRPHEEIILSIASKGELGILVEKNKSPLKNELRAAMISLRPLKVFDIELETRIGPHKLKLVLRKA